MLRYTYMQISASDFRQAADSPRHPRGPFMDIRRMADSRVQNAFDGGYILLSTGRNLSFKYSLYEGASIRGCSINNTNYEN